MRRILTISGLVVALAAPSFAPTAARAESCEQRAHDHKVVGTLLGAVAGGFLGNAVARGGGRTGGTIIGAGAGAVVGNNLARTHCGGYRHAYYRHRAPVEPRYAPATYAGGSYAGGSYASGPYAGGQACHTETRQFYDARGQLVYAPTQVCG